MIGNDESLLDGFKGSMHFRLMYRPRTLSRNSSFSTDGWQRDKDDEPSHSRERGLDLILVLDRSDL